MDDAVNLILEGFGGRSANPDKFKAYAMALEGFPVENIARGVKAILRGEVDGVDPAFPPTTAQLAKACRPITFLSRPAEYFQGRPEPDPVPSEAQKARVDDLIRDAVAAMTRHRDDR